MTMYTLSRLFLMVWIPAMVYLIWSAISPEVREPVAAFAKRHRGLLIFSVIFGTLASVGLVLGASRPGSSPNAGLRGGGDGGDGGDGGGDGGS